MACPDCGGEFRHAAKCSRGRERIKPAARGKHTRPPRSSWWIGLPRQEFNARLAQESERMRRGGVSDAQVLDA